MYLGRARVLTVRGRLPERLAADRAQGESTSQHKSSQLPRKEALQELECACASPQLRFRGGDRPGTYLVASRP